MADIRLISILPQQGVQPSPVSQGASSQRPTIQVQLPAGSILSGFIVNRDTLGNPVLRTDSGDVTFHSDIFLKIGSEVVIRLIGTQNAQTARIISVDGRPPDAPSPQADEPDVIVSRALTPDTQTTAAPRSPSSPITATIVSPAPASPAAPSLPAGTSLAVRIVAPEPAVQPSSPIPAANIAPALSTYTRTAVAAAPPANSPPPTLAAPAPAAAAPPQAPPDPRAELLALAAAVKAPPAAAPATPAATPSPIIPAATPPAVPAGQVIVGTVVAPEPSGATLVQTPLGTLRLSTPTPLAIGSKVMLETLPLPAAQAAPLPAPVPAPFTEIARQWTSLQQIAQLLASSGLPMQPGMPSLLPSASGNAISPKEISSGLMFFIAALKGGNFRNWLGENSVQWLQNNGHAALLKKAEAEFTFMGRTFAETPVPGQPQQPWQALVFPFAAYGHWQQARIFVKRDRDPEKKQPGKKQGDTRFVIEVTLSQLGEMQMDGFVRRKKEATEFDLFIRSHAPLDREVEREISRIYSETGEAAGYRGSLVFQAVRDFPVNPMEEIAEHMAGVIA